MKKRLTLFLLVLFLLSVQPALAAEQEITPGPGAGGAEGTVEVDMNIDEGFVVVIPGALTITPGVGGREYAVGEVRLTEMPLYGSRSLRLCKRSSRQLSGHYPLRCPDRAGTVGRRRFDFASNLQLCLKSEIGTILCRSFFAFILEMAYNRSANYVQLIMRRTE